VSETQAKAGADALLPAILGGFKKQAQAQPAGLDGLMNTVGGLGGMLGGLIAVGRRQDSPAPGGWRRCWISIATVTRSATSSAWPGAFSAESDLASY
jgi:hypothetical protein